MKVSDKQLPEHMEGVTKTHSAKKRGSVSKAGLSEKISAGDEIGSAKVKLSDRAQDMKKIREAVDKTPDVDEAKVAKYKSMLAKGEYKVDSKAVADRLVDEHAYNDLLSGLKDE